MLYHERGLKRTVEQLRKFMDPECKIDGSSNKGKAKLCIRKTHSTVKRCLLSHMRLWFLQWE